MDFRNQKGILTIFFIFGLFIIAGSLALIGVVYSKRTGPTSLTHNKTSVIRMQQEPTTAQADQLTSPAYYTNAEFEVGLTKALELTLSPGEITKAFALTSLNASSFEFTVKPSELEQILELNPTQGITAPANSTMIEIEIQNDAQPGEYTGSFSLKQQNGTQELQIPVKITVQ